MYLTPAKFVQIPSAVLGKQIPILEEYLPLGSRDNIVERNVGNPKCGMLNVSNWKITARCEDQLLFNIASVARRNWFEKRVLYVAMVL